MNGRKLSLWQIGEGEKFFFWGANNPRNRFEIEWIELRGRIFCVAVKVETAKKTFFSHPRRAESKTFPFRLLSSVYLYSNDFSFAIVPVCLSAICLLLLAISVSYAPCGHSFFYKFSISSSRRNLFFLPSRMLATEISFPLGPTTARRRMGKMWKVEELKLIEKVCSARSIFR